MFFMRCGFPRTNRYSTHIVLFCDSRTGELHFERCVFGSRAFHVNPMLEMKNISRSAEHPVSMRWCHKTQQNPSISPEIETTIYDASTRCACSARGKPTPRWLRDAFFAFVGWLWLMGLRLCSTAIWDRLYSAPQLGDNTRVSHITRSVYRLIFLLTSFALERVRERERQVSQYVIAVCNIIGLRIASPRRTTDNWGMLYSLDI